MKLSIIVPVYNMAGGGKLNFCLDSLVNQTISDYEIICVDDASTDNSVEILEQTGVLDEEKHKKLILRSGSMVIKVYKHQVIVDNHLDFPEGIFYEDNCAGPVWSAYFTRFEKVEEPLYYYYQHDSSTVHCVAEAKCKDRMIAGELLLKEFKNRELLEQYKEEVEYRFTELYFENTLFSYMLGAKKRRLAFVEELKEGMQKAFPEFERNSYYQLLSEPEHKEMIRILMSDSLQFFCCINARHLSEIFVKSGRFRYVGKY